MHATCAEGAAYYQAKADAEEAALQAGDLLVTSAQGDRAPGVPEGYAKVTFHGKDGAESVVLIPRESYNPQVKPKLSDYPEAVAACPRPASADATGARCLQPRRNRGSFSEGPTVRQGIAHGRCACSGR